MKNSDYRRLMLNYYDKHYSKDEEKAKEVIIVIYKMLLQTKPDRRFYKVTTKVYHLSYIFSLINLKMYIQNSEYHKALGELMDVIHDNFVFQPRVWYNLIEILSKVQR